MEDEIQVDHLKCKREGQHELWVRPEADDIHVVHIVQVLPINVIGEWDFSKRIYCVQNLKDIENAFNVL